MTTTTIPAKYDFRKSEEKWQKYWEGNKIYESKADFSKKKYSVVIPPPNITGMLHIGHILNNTIQDIYCRWKRMSGYEVCWVPGMDHAGIATQIKVEQELKKEGKTKYDLGRDKFVKMIWDWKEKYGGIILHQLRRLGASVDWSKERFTLDEGLSKAVREVFVDLYKKGYIYKGKRIINWDSITQTALSDDEISYREQKDKLYYIRYPVENSSESLIIATTRPETMLGDTAVAVNSEDARYKHLKGTNVILPLVNKKIPVIYDSYVDITFGTGALKITPAHDINDFEVGQRHNLETVNILTKDGKLNENGLEFSGQPVNEARRNILKKLKDSGYYIKEEDYTHNVAVSERSGGIIEPFLSDQWFVSMKKLAEPAIEVVKEGKVRFHPDRWTKTYFHWLENVKDWCISRQLWWGHQIPIWYHKQSGEIYCETKPPEDIDNWEQDPDVLDTWFSSWLWPFSVFGWENSEKDRNNDLLKYYYPTDFLSTAPEIIFLWVARMIISGLEYINDIPFRDVYFHSTVRDAKGRKMSKSLGNSPDPLDLMNNYGTDALRFTIVYLAPLGSDVLFDEKNTEIGRNFITKLWNAGRFLMMYKEKIYKNGKNTDGELILDITEKWIDSRFNETISNIEYYLNSYRLNDYTKTIYNFVWSDFCDWYIELLKIKISAHPEQAKKLIDRALNKYQEIIKMLHPVIPFSTEEIWHLLEQGRDGKSISFETFPRISGEKIDTIIEEKFENLKEIVTTIRNLKSENDIPQKTECKIYLIPSDKASENNLEGFGDTIETLCRIKLHIKSEDVNEKYISKVLNNYQIHLHTNDLPADESRIDIHKKELENLEKYLNTLDRKLGNKNFLEKATKEVIAKEKQKHIETVRKIEKLKNLIGL
ncbi:MAG: valine--tRNA ligase [Ignavibacteria bacterium]|nr:valine--tRNA ligase [Ignavibacteria bacterium]